MADDAKANGEREAEEAPGPIDTVRVRVGREGDQVHGLAVSFSKVEDVEHRRMRLAAALRSFADYVERGSADNVLTPTAAEGTDDAR